MSTRSVVLILFFCASVQSNDDKDFQQACANKLEQTYRRLKEFAQQQEEVVEKICTMTPLETGYLYDYDPYQQCKDEVREKIISIVRKKGEFFQRVNSEPNKPKPDIALSQQIGLMRYRNGFCVSAAQFDYKKHELNFLEQSREQFMDWNCKQQREFGGGEMICCAKE